MAEFNVTIYQLISKADELEQFNPMRRQHSLSLQM